MTNSTVLYAFPPCAYVSTALASSVAGSTFMPAPTWKTFATTSPMASATVVSASK